MEKTADVCKRFSGDRYERLHQGVQVLLADPAYGDASTPCVRDGLMAVAAAITDAKAFDHLSEKNADMVIALLLIDFHRGATEISRRLWRLISAAQSDGQPNYDALAVISGLAAVLALLVALHE